MSESTIRNRSFKDALFSGSMDAEGMEDVLQLYRDLFPVVSVGAGEGADTRELGEEEIQMRLDEGFTLLEPVDILPDTGELAKRAEEVVKILVGHSEDAETVTLTMSSLLEDPDAFHGLAAVWLKEGDAVLREKLGDLEGVNPEAVMFVLFNSLKGSFLEAAARFSHFDTGKWEQGRCPVCGGEPAAAYTMGEGGKRHLICHRCETHWRFRRLTCPYCGHESPEESGYLFSEDPEYRFLTGAVCGECRSYIKSWRVEGDDPGDLHPEVEDLKTPGFDRAVEGESYRRGAPNIFGVRVGTAEDKGRPERV
ncbi:MAG: formate dehydrogenase accessory protein FdhE [bacterium]|nr:formate dehydrogenase accessory protein FdhE [bacterium]MDT8395183.1 formate dehydrogenase accessory protein FdhE [bacterium]